MIFSDLTKAATEIAVQAGAFLRESFTKPYQVFSKDGKKNLVTDCDLRSEEMILTFLQKQFPTHRFLSEEEGVRGGASSEVLWIIDPLDGTVNFAYHIPIFTVSIAACIGEDVVTGVVFQPMFNELFIAEKNKGAFLNYNPIQTSEETCLENAFLATGFPYSMQQKLDMCIHPFFSFLQKGMHIRRLGSAALDLAYVAAGRFDAYWEAELQPWDIAAGMLLVQEAGGIISDYEGAVKSPTQPSSLVASNSYIHTAMLQSIQKACV